MWRASLLLFVSVVLVGCSSRGGKESSDGGKGAPAPGPIVENVCPVRGLRAQELVDRVRAIRDDETIEMTVELRAGYLAIELANVGVSEKDILKSFTNGKFAALASWLGHHVRTVDINKFSNCEGN